MKNMTTTFSKHTTLFLIGLLTLSTLFLPLTTLRAATLTNGMDASYVFNSDVFNAVGLAVHPPDASDVTQGDAITYDPVRKRLFVADDANFRVLVFDLSSGVTGNNMDATWVLGQEDFTSYVETSTQDGLGRQIAGIAYASDKLYVTDRQNSRVMVFDVAEITNGEDAVAVLGQNDFTSNTPNRGISAAQGNLNYPNGAAISGNNLFVADQANYRVQVFDVASITNGESSTYVIGQDDFSSTVQTTTQNGIWAPVNMAVNDQYLFLIDQDYGQTATRILVFDISGGLSNGMAADYVLGQADFTSRVGDNSRVTSSSFNQAQSLHATNDTLYVNDSYNSRVLIFDISEGITNEMAASYVLGQEDFVTNTANVNGLPGGGGGKGGGILPCIDCLAVNSGGIYYDSAEKLLFVGDAGNNRMMVWDLTPTSSSSSSFTYTHPPTCSATFSPSTITQGQQTTLSWNTQWPTERTNTYYTKVPGEGLYSQNVSSLTLQPQHTTTYTLAIFNLWGANFCNTTITVLDSEGQELTSNNSTLTAGVSHSPIVRAITSFFTRLFTN